MALGGGGSPIFSPPIFYFVSSNPMQNFRTLGQPREKNAVNSGHLVPWQCMQVARTKMAARNFDYTTLSWNMTIFWFLGSVLPPYLTLSVYPAVTIKFRTKDDWKVRD